MKNFLIFGALFLLGVICIFLFNRNNTISNEQGVANNLVIQHVPIVSDSKNVSAAQAVVSTSNVKDVEWPKTLDEEKLAQQEVLKWRFSRGWYDPYKPDDYQTYSRDVLHKLADNGDIHAMHLLARRAPEKEQIELMKKAAIYGSTFAFDVLEINITTSVSNSNLSEADKKIKLIDAAAYKKVAMLRGDHFEFFADELSGLENSYAIKFSDQDKESIDARSKEIYSELENKRIELGLGKFDNSVPPIVQAFYKVTGYK